MSDVTHLDSPRRKFLEGMLFYMLVLTSLAVLLFLVAIILGFVPVAVSS